MSNGPSQESAGENLLHRRSIRNNQQTQHTPNATGNNIALPVQSPRTGASNSVHRTPISNVNSATLPRQTPYNVASNVVHRTPISNVNSATLPRQTPYNRASNSVHRTPISNGSNSTLPRQTPYNRASNVVHRTPISNVDDTMLQLHSQTLYNGASNVVHRTPVSNVDDTMLQLHSQTLYNGASNVVHRTPISNVDDTMLQLHSQTLYNGASNVVHRTPVSNVDDTMLQLHSQTLYNGASNVVHRTPISNGSNSTLPRQTPYNGASNVVHRTPISNVDDTMLQLHSQTLYNGASNVVHRTPISNGSNSTLPRQTPYNGASNVVHRTPVSNGSNSTLIWKSPSTGACSSVHRTSVPRAAVSSEPTPHNVTLVGGGSFEDGHDYNVSDKFGKTVAMTWKNGKFYLKNNGPPSLHGANLTSKIPKENIVLEGGGHFKNGEKYLVRDRHGNSRKMIWQNGSMVSYPNTTESNVSSRASTSTGVTGQNSAQRNPTNASLHQSTMRPEFIKLIKQVFEMGYNKLIVMAAAKLISKKGTAVPDLKEFLEKVKKVQEHYAARNQQGASGCSMDTNNARYAQTSVTSQSSTSTGASGQNPTQEIPATAYTSSQHNSLKLDLQNVMKQVMELGHKKELVIAVANHITKRGIVVPDVKQFAEWIEKVKKVQEHYAARNQQGAAECSMDTNNARYAQTWVSSQPSTSTWMSGQNQTAANPANDSLLQATIRLDIMKLMKQVMDLGYNKELVDSVAKNVSKGGIVVPVLNLFIDELENARKLQESAATRDQQGAAGCSKDLNGAQTSGWCELKDEFEKLKDQKQCKICMERDIEITFIPCGHFATCEQCGKPLTSCPICRQSVKSYVKTFMS